jgi:exoribonuclease-2
MKENKASTPHATQMTNEGKNRLVQYDDAGAVVLGLIVATRKDKQKVLNVRGRELELASSRLHVLPGALGTEASSTKMAVTELERLDELITSRSKSLDIKELWTFIADDAREYSAKELCEMYLGEDTQVDHAALRVAIINEHVHFKRTKSGFEPRSEEVIAGLKQAAAVKAKREAQRKEALSFMKQRLHDSTLEPSESVQGILTTLKEIAAQSVHIEPGQLKEAKEFLRHLSEALKLGEISAPEKSAYKALRKTKFIDEHTNLSFIRHRIPEKFSDEIIALAKSVSTGTTSEEFRVDYTHADAFTIDDASTRDMDDAISIERVEGGYELGIHITDVSSAFESGSQLDEIAKNRATSIYCADRVVNMLPRSLSEELLSLKVGEVRPCLSVFVALSDDLQLLSSRVQATKIKITTRYSYDQVDDLLQHCDKVFLRLYEIASIHEARRIARGAVKVHKREVVPYYRGSQVVLHEVDEESPARNLVAEMMVMANSVFAQYAIDHKIPVLFRGQEASNRGLDAHNEIPEGPAKDFKARTSLKKSSVSLEPTSHAGLGLACYVQCTSPIRRYMDLCHQRQFISFLRDGVCELDSERFLQLANEVEGPLRAASLASRETKRYWLLTYLAQRDRELPIDATVVRTDLKSPLVELDEVFFTALVKLNKNYQLGDKVRLKICSVDAHADYLRLQEV